MRRLRILLSPFLTAFLVTACTVVSDGTLSVTLTFPPDNTVTTGAPVAAAGSAKPRYPKNVDNRILIRVLAPHLPAPIEAWFDRSAGRGEITGIPPGTRITVEVDEYDNTARTLLTNAPLLGRGWAQGITLSPGEFREVPITMYDKGTIVRVCGAPPTSGAGTSG
ncbi:MAG: hypothetical protein C3F14_11335, partial [Deltaproteobacteria bacterium]